MSITLNTATTTVSKNDSLFESKTTAKKKKKPSEFLAYYQNNIEYRQHKNKKNNLHNNTLLNKKPFSLQKNLITTINQDKSIDTAIQKKEKDQVSTQTHKRFTASLDNLTNKNQLQVTHNTQVHANLQINNQAASSLKALQQTTIKEKQENITKITKSVATHHHHGLDKKQFLSHNIFFDTSSIHGTLPFNPATIPLTLSTSINSSNSTIQSKLTHRLIPILLQHVKADSQHIIIHLEPKHLGSLNIIINKNNQKPTITISAESDSTKELLQQQLPQLMQSLQQELPKLSVNILSTVIQQQTVQTTDQNLRFDRRMQKDNKRYNRLESDTQEQEKAK